ncbi:MAG TPA: PIN domain nuclease, partial [Thermoanaerobaculia bacterium]|nr:PIN domain nuclease [Thermoanaerobaculia bacterium]
MSAAEAPPQFVDTNVLLYRYDVTASAKRELASALVSGLWDSGSGAVSMQVLQEFFSAATRKLAKPLSTSEARDI